jgi:hypothetical protein
MPHGTLECELFFEQSRKYSVSLEIRLNIKLNVKAQPSTVLIKGVH